MSRLSREILAVVSLSAVAIGATACASSVSTTPSREVPGAATASRDIDHMASEVIGIIPASERKSPPGDKFTRNIFLALGGPDSFTRLTVQTGSSTANAAKTDTLDVVQFDPSGVSFDLNMSKAADGAWNVSCSSPSVTIAETNDQQLTLDNHQPFSDPEGSDAVLVDSIDNIEGFLRNVSVATKVAPNEPLKPFTNDICQINIGN